MQKLFSRQSDAAGRGRETRPRHVDENCTTQAGDARPGIVVDFHNEIVEAIASAQAVAWFIGRPPESPVVAPIPGIFAPGIVWPDSANRQQHARPDQAIGPPPQLDRMKPAGWRRAVTFPFRRFDARPARCDLERPVPRREPALVMPVRTASDMYDRKRNSSHSWISACVPTAQSSNVPIRKFAKSRGTFWSGLRNRKDTSKFMILVWFPI